jgi:bifunctional oligoribonuclease and PAP phosphatase NrnA
MSNPVIDAIRQQLHEAGTVLIVSHVRPDGDAIGSMLGLGLALEEAGKQVKMVLQDGVPSSLKFMEGTEKVVTRIEGGFDVLVAVDCSDLQRVGDILNGHHAPNINIDHHITNTNFGELNLVEVEAVATSEILAHILEDLKLPITKSVADALITGIITDTIGFRTSNMTPRALRVTADLMEAGARLTELYNLSLVRRSFESAYLWGMGLSKIQREGPITWTTLTLSDKKIAKYQGRDDADLINNLAAIDGAVIAIVFVEQAAGTVKISWRAQPGWDVANIASYFRGGGHTAAAGAEIEGPLDEVVKKVIKTTKAMLE